MWNVDGDDNGDDNGHGNGDANFVLAVDVEMELWGIKWRLHGAR